MRLVFKYYRQKLVTEPKIFWFQNINFQSENETVRADLLYVRIFF